MNRVTKAVAALAVLPAIAFAVTGTASAAPAQPASKHTGTAGCFNWSWADGTSTTTVYYHNTCNHSEQIHIWWQVSSTVERLHAPTVAAGAKGHVKEDGKVKSIDD
ncbi:MAG: hypothetical protein JWQ81_198 [Amycolatopsis sp.]|jgi:hypothetical protein|uniref:hypothetical protein n=1 Tax=Amycolatopsis sp. TaxID=37632 RepID=UPI00262E2D86|nr:hypothetical protein [Amycolatopsis sp.]MCU1679459.1 hypothetical protein [Amycolatopsis sp.]